MYYESGRISRVRENRKKCVRSSCVLLTFLPFSERVSYTALGNCRRIPAATTLLRESREREKNILLFFNRVYISRVQYRSRFTFSPETAAFTVFFRAQVGETG